MKNPKTVMGLIGLLIIGYGGLILYHVSGRGRKSLDADPEVPQVRREDRGGSLENAEDMKDPGDTRDSENTRDSEDMNRIRGMIFFVMQCAKMIFAQEGAI